jgi:hypothetical protein
LLQRGVREDRARQLLLDLPDDQPALEQIEWGDAEITRKRRSNDPILNPPGFYIHLLRVNYPVPAGFEPRSRRRIRDEATVAESLRAVYGPDIQEEYEAFLIEQTDAHIKDRIPPAALDRQLRTHMKKLKDECPQYRWPEPTLRDVAWRNLRKEIAEELNLPTLDEFASRKAESLF